MYEWDDAKNALNIAKHGIDFDLARQIFDGPVLTATDDRKDYGEVREISIGVIGKIVIITVVHTSRYGRVRIISARTASQSERRRYEQAIR
jgi:uncharacterized DUF497 family protein